MVPSHKGRMGLEKFSPKNANFALSDDEVTKRLELIRKCRVCPASSSCALGTAVTRQGH